MKGWLLDTNVIATLINPNGVRTVKAWAAVQDEGLLYLSVLTLGEYDKGIHLLAIDHPQRSRYAAARDALEARFAQRILSVTDAVVRSWGRISGTVQRETGDAMDFEVKAALERQFDLEPSDTGHARRGTDVPSPG